MLIWGGLLAGVTLVARALSELAVSGSPSVLPKQDWWWALVAVPVPVWIFLLSRLREAESVAARQQQKWRDLLPHYLACWAMATVPGLTGAVLGLISGNLL
ncbi:MAG: hypothetical protein ACK4UT_02930, partial [Moraxellaceae bacterium]